MAGTYLNATAGYIMNAGAYTKRGTITNDEKMYLRELAKKVAEIAALPVQKEREKGWTAHNDLKDKKPMSICYPEDGWGDLLPVKSVKVKDSFFANYEWYLRHLIYRHENITDDFVTKPEICAFYKFETENADWGLGEDKVTISAETTSFDWGERPLADFDNMKNLKAPVINVLREESEADFEALSEIFGDILDINRFFMNQVYGPTTLSCNQPGIAARLRGIEQIMYDMYDYPDELHYLLDFITDANFAFLKKIESEGLVRSNTDNYYTDAGGNGYTNELPKPHDGAKLMDCIGYGVAQEYSEVSPEMHDEFGIKYQNKILGLFGMNVYGCCEPYTNKFDIVKKIPRLRRVSVSPFCGFQRAAEELGSDYIYSFKPNPALLISDIPMETIRTYLRDILNTAKDCCVEVFLKDIIHLNTPAMQQRFKDVSVVIREEINRLW